MVQIVTIPGVLTGRPMIEGTRITVAEVLEMFAAGMTEADILEAFPKLSAEGIRAALAYAAANFDHPVVTA
jgi:uncharacterized protein (DUF433 family)